MNSNIKAVFWGLLLTGGLVFAASVDAQQKGGKGPAKVYRWVDENGEVHFSETPPVEVQNDASDVQRNAGRGWQKDGMLTPSPEPKPKPKPKPGKDELPRDSSGLPRPKPRYTPAQVRAQQDNLLLLRYDSDQEILDAMRVEIKQLDYDRRVLQTSKKSLMKSYRDNVREAAERQRAGLKVENKLVNEIRGLKQRLNHNQKELAGLKAREDSIRNSFQADLERYRTLVAARAEAQARK